MALTSSVIIIREDGWTLIASNPAAITVKSNMLPYMTFEITIAPNLPPTDFKGEQHPGGTSWESQGFAGNLYLRAHKESQHFAITQ